MTERQDMNIVQSFWFGDKLPAIQRLSIRSFLANGHEYHLYTYDNIDGVPPGTFVKDASAILPLTSVFAYQQGFGKGSYSAFSNLFRYKLIHDKGGWWVDTDVVCLRPFVFDREFLFATEYETDFSVQCSTSVFKAAAGSPFLRYCIDIVNKKDKAALEWAEIGPILFDGAVRKFDLTAHQVDVGMFSPINYFDFAALLEPGFDLSRLDNSYSVHLWNQMWRANNICADVEAAAGSLYRMLMVRYPTAG